LEEVGHPGNFCLPFYKYYEIKHTAYSAHTLCLTYYCMEVRIFEYSDCQGGHHFISRNQESARRKETSMVVHPKIKVLTSFKTCMTFFILCSGTP